MAGMKQATAWLQEQWAIVIETIKDPDKGHGGLMLNAINARHVLDSSLNRFHIKSLNNTVVWR